MGAERDSEATEKERCLKIKVSQQDIQPFQFPLARTRPISCGIGPYVLVAMDSSIARSILLFVLAGLGEIGSEYLVALAARVPCRLPRMVR
ncbi:hypothetical protein BH24CHL3_BH24CHL3_07910 [soil metagenome]